MKLTMYINPSEVAKLEYSNADQEIMVMTHDHRWAFVQDENSLEQLAKRIFKEWHQNPS